MGWIELDAIGVDDPEHRRSSQEILGPVLMGREETKEPGALGEPGKQRPIVAASKTDRTRGCLHLEGMEQPQGAHLAGPEVGLGMFRDGAHLLIDLIEQRRDQLMESKDGVRAASQTVDFRPALPAPDK